MSQVATETLRGIPEIRRFFRPQATPVYFVSATAFNLLGMDQWVRSLTGLTPGSRRLGSPTRRASRASPTCSDERRRRPRSTTYSRGFGTLYPAAYNLPDRAVDYLWLGASWSHSLHTFEPSTHVEALVEASVA